MAATLTLLGSPRDAWGKPSAGDPGRFVELHGSELLRVARRFAGSEEDAHDALQRGFEVLLRKGDALAPEWALPYIKVVVRHEAFALSRERRRTRSIDHWELDGLEEHRSPSADELCERLDLRRRARRDLAKLKQDERRALVLLAAGYSYKQICELTGWSYTKTNRCIAEGRERLRRLEPAAPALRAAV